MSVLEILLRNGPMPAADVAEALGMPIEEVYQFLVRDEARGVVEVRSPHRDNQSVGRVWATTYRAEIVDQLPPALQGGALGVF